MTNSFEILMQVIKNKNKLVERICSDGTHWKILFLISRISKISGYVFIYVIGKKNEYELKRV